MTGGGAALRCRQMRPCLRGNSPRSPDTGELPFTRQRCQTGPAPAKCWPGPQDLGLFKITKAPFQRRLPGRVLRPVLVNRRSRGDRSADTSRPIGRGWDPVSWRGAFSPPPRGGPSNLPDVPRPGCDQPAGEHLPRTRRHFPWVGRQTILYLGAFHATQISGL